MLRGWKAGPKSGTLSCAKSRALSTERWSYQHESELLGTAEPITGAAGFSRQAGLVLRAAA